MSTANSPTTTVNDPLRPHGVSRASAGRFWWDSPALEGSAPVSAASSSPTAGADEAPAGVEVQDLVVSYGDHRVLSDLSLTIPAGHVAAVLGPSGSGKTTLLRTIVGFLRPQGGVVRVNGRAVAGGGAWVPPEKRDIGLVPQEGALFPHLDVFDNIGFGLARRTARQRRARSERVDELLELVDLAGIAHKRPHELSGGMQQRVALARALARCPQVVALDEPFSSLDSALRRELRSQVKQVLAAIGTTVLLVTHDEEEAAELATDLHTMDSGHLTTGRDG